MDKKYEIIIFWSSKDDAYIAEVPELPGCMADGKTQMSADRTPTDPYAKLVKQQLS